MAGQAYNLNNNADFALARYNADGSLDKNFDHDGKQTTDFFGGNDYASAISVQSDGKIVVAGYTVDANTGNYNFAVARYTTTGSPDKTFDGDGKQTTDFFNDYDAANAMAIQSNGKIVVAGVAYDPINRQEKFALVRYNTNGSLDNTFDGDGKQTTDFFGSYNVANALAIQSDGKIVVAGQAYPINSSNADLALARYNADGSLDNTFGENKDGKQTTDFFGNYDVANALAVQSDGKIVVAGGTYNPTNRDFDLALARYNADGSLDNTFGENRDGKQTTDFFGSYNDARAIGLQSDGKIVVAGQAYGTNNSSSNFALARYTADGSLDNSFGVIGKETFNFFSSNELASSLCLRNNKLFVAGYSNGLSETGVVAAFSPGIITSAKPAITTVEVNGLGNEQALLQRLTIKALPNPSANYFTLLLNSPANNAAAIRVNDASGKLIEVKNNIAGDSKIQFGGNYPRGVYYVQVMQGNKMTTLKLVKQ